MQTDRTVEVLYTITMNDAEMATLIEIFGEYRKLCRNLPNCVTLVTFENTLIDEFIRLANE